MKKTHYIFTFFLLVSVLSISTAFAANPADLILEARNNAAVWETGKTYLVDDIVSFNGVIYKTVQEHTSEVNWAPPNVPALFTEYSFQDLGEVPIWKQPTGAQDAYQTNDNVRYEGYIFTSTIDANTWSPDAYPQGWEEVAIDTGKTLANSKSVAFKDNTFYSSTVAVQGLQLTGTENVVTDRQLVGLSDYEKENFTVSMYTGNDNIKYSIYSYTNQSDNTSLTTNRSLIRQEGTHLFDVVSTDGFITYQTNGFSTQIASIPNMLLDYTEVQTLNIENYFTSYTEDEVFIYVPSGSSNAGCDQVINGNCRIQKDGPGVDFTPLAVEHTSTTDLGATQDTIKITAKSVDYSEPITIAVNDGSTFLSDSFSVTIAAASDPTVTTTAVSNIGTTSATVGVELTDMGGESSLNVGVEYREVGTSQWNLAGSTTGVTGLTSQQYTITGLTAGTTYEVEAYADDGTVQYFGNNVQFTTTTSGGGVIVNAPNTVNVVGAYTLTDATDSTPNAYDGTVVGATSGATGIIGDAYDLDGVEDVISIDGNIINTSLVGSSAVTFSAWIEPDTVSSNQLILYSRGSSSDNAQIDLALIGDKIRLGGRSAGSDSFESITGSTSLDASSGFYHICGILDYANDRVIVRLNGQPDFNSSSGIAWGNSVLTGGSRYFNIGSIGNGVSSFDGVIDEVQIFDTALNPAQCDYLYASGSPTSDQQYPYTVPLYPPTQDAPVPDFSVDEGTTESISLGTYFTNFTSFSVNYTNPDTSTVETLSGATDTSTNTYFTINTVDGTSTKSIEIVGIEATPLPALNTLTIEVCNDDGCIVDDANTYINNVPTPPTQLQTLPLINAEINETVTYDLDNYFSGFDSLGIVYTNSTSTGTFSTSSTTTYNDAKYTLTFDNITNVMTVTGVASATELPYGVLAQNEDGAIQGDGTISVYEAGASPPTQINTLPTLVVDINAQETINIPTYISDYNEFNIYMNDPDNFSFVNLSAGQSTSNSLFDLAITNTTVSVTGKTNSTFASTINACNDNGCTQTTLDILVTDTVYTPPSELGKMFNSFGETSSIVKLIVGIGIILSLMLMGWFYTKTIVIAMVSALFGLIISVAVGLISIWLVLLVILIAMIPIIYKIMFGNRGA